MKILSIIFKRKLTKEVEVEEKEEEILIKGLKI